MSGQKKRLKLILLADKCHYSEIAEELGRTTKVISAKAEELGYQKRMIKSRNNGGESNG